MVNHKITPRHGGKRNYFTLFQWSRSVLLDSLTEKWTIMSARAILLDNFNRKTHETDREKPSIGQF